MKPVIEVIVDKNGGEATNFHPTAKMILFSIYKARNPSLSEKEVCELAGLDGQNPMRWSRKYGAWYVDWLEEACDAEAGQDDALVLERIGMIQATQAGNYQYWRDMARQKGVIKDEVKPSQITINTDFTAIIAMGDLNAVRSRMLHELRGVVPQGGPGMALPPPIGERKSPGSGAGSVQSGPMEMVNALGSNRGRPEQRKSLSAVPEQDPPAMSYEILDEREVSPDTEEPANDLHLADSGAVPARQHVLSVEDDDLSM